MNAINAYAFGGVTFYTTVTTFGSSGSYSTTAGTVGPVPSGNEVVLYAINPSGTGIYVLRLL